MSFNHIYVVFLILLYGCVDVPKKNKKAHKGENPKGMVWIPQGTYMMGAVTDDYTARNDEFPQHRVFVDGFWIDTHEVTNAQFAEFVDATNYITLAERPVDWNKMKKQLPQGTPKPNDSLLHPGSVSFHCKTKNVNLNDISQWWTWKINTNWKHPQGEGSTIQGKDQYPVVHIAYEDALAYCKWANRSIPTEAEWEYAARGSKENQIFTWGNDQNLISKNANTWQGKFPTKNTKEDGYVNSAPVKSYPPNAYGLYDMSGNVWEWTQDWYDMYYYRVLASQKTTSQNPQGPEEARNPRNPYTQEKTIRGGSFLCHDSYCASYRISARMASTPDTGLEHLGFRTVLRPKK